MNFDFNSPLHQSLLGQRVRWNRDKEKKGRLRWIHSHPNEQVNPLSLSLSLVLAARVEGNYTWQLLYFDLLCIKTNHWSVAIITSYFMKWRPFSRPSGVRSLSLSLTHSLTYSFSPSFSLSLSFSPGLFSFFRQKWTHAAERVCVCLSYLYTFATTACKSRQDKCKLGNWIQAANK